MKQIKTTHKMATSKIGKLLFTMSIPAIFSMLIQALYNIVDSLYVSRITETNNELTALNYAFPIQMIVLAISLGIGVGTSSVISRCLGAKKTKKKLMMLLKQVLLLLSLRISLLLVVVSLFLNSL